MSNPSNGSGQGQGNEATGVIQSVSREARLPGLAPFVPPPRKYPESEDARVNLFDAASLALALVDAAAMDSPADDLAA